MCNLQLTYCYSPGLLYRYRVELITPKRNRLYIKHFFATTIKIRCSYCQLLQTIILYREKHTAYTMFRSMTFKQIHFRHLKQTMKSSTTPAPCPSLKSVKRAYCIATKQPHECSVQSYKITDWCFKFFITSCTVITESRRSPPQRSP